MDQKKNAVLKRIGNIFTIICAAFIIWTVARMDVDWAAILRTKHIGPIFLALSFLSVIQYSLGPIAWRCLLMAISGKEIPFKNVYYIYSKSNLAKYLPGNVMHFAGRNLLGEELGVRQADIALATVFEIILTLVSAVFLALVFSSSYLLQTIRLILENPGYRKTLMLLAAAGMILLAAVAVLAAKNRKVKQYLVQLVSRDNLAAVLKTLPIYWPSFLIVGLINVLIFSLVLGVKMEPGTAVSVIGLTIISWLVGYIVPGAPGGIGVREAVSVLLMAPLLGTENVIVAAVLLRVVNVIGDVLMYLIGSIIHGSKEENRLNKKTGV